MAQQTLTAEQADKIARLGIALENAAEDTDLPKSVHDSLVALAALYYATMLQPLTQSATRSAEKIAIAALLNGSKGVVRSHGRE